VYLVEFVGVFDVHVVDVDDDWVEVFGGGGGGCVQIEYGTSNTISSSAVSMNGGTGSQIGGAGQLFVKKTGDYGDLYVLNTAPGGPASTQEVSALAAASLSLSYANYTVPSGKTIDFFSTLNDPFGVSSNYDNYLTVGGDVNLHTNTINKATLVLNSGSTFTNSSTIAINENAGLRINSGASILNAITNLTTSGTLYVDEGGVFSINALTMNAGTTTLSNYSTSTPALNLTTFTMNGGTLTHLANDTTQNHILNISANDITINSGASINVDSKGYGPQLSNNQDGYGPGKGRGGLTGG
jgi:hypothetical protein